MFMAMLLIVQPVKATQVNRFYAVFIVGTEEFPINAQYLYSHLVNFYGLDEWFGSLYRCTKREARDAVAQLANASNYGDLVLIYIAAHGGGYNITNNRVIGRIDYDGDEGPEVYNETTGMWFGVDEGVAMWPYEQTGQVDDTTIYWDDELRDDLQRVRYGRMIICIEGCKFLNSTENDRLGCYSGGFIVAKNYGWRRT